MIAGYNPVEVNASDDCSAEAFRLQLEAATQMRSVIGDNPRPNCLILDEIDGSLSVSVCKRVLFSQCIIYVTLQKEVKL